MKHKRTSIALFVALAMTAGCTLTPEYQKPEAPIAQQYSVASVSPMSSALDWHTFFTDPTLKSLLQDALANNRDYRVAALNIERARALYRIQRADLLPTINASGGGTAQRVPRDLSMSGQVETTHQYGAGVGFTAYEVDFFGRVRSLNEQALETYFATIEAKRSATLSLVAEVASAYYQLQADNELLALSRRTLDIQQDSYKLVRSSYDNDVATELDLSQAESTVRTAESAIARYQRLVEQDQNALVLLIGKPVDVKSLATEKLSSFDLKEPILPGAPSELLAARPDILAAEHRLKAANANIGAARAAFFPSITLTASAGSASAELGDLFAGGQGAWSFVPSVNIPIFNYGRNKANLEVAKVQNAIEVANYQKAIQVAFREVSDALASKSLLDAQVNAEDLRVKANARSYNLADQRYREGVDTFLNSLDAQRSLFAAQQDLVVVKLAKINNAISLYKTLGGGETQQPLGL